MNVEAIAQKRYVELLEQDRATLPPGAGLTEARRATLWTWAQQYAANEDARARRMAARDQTRAQEAQTRAAEHAALIEGYRVAVRGAWIGDDASFAAAWPQLLERWQSDQAAASAADPLAAKRASGNYGGF